MMTIDALSAHFHVNLIESDYCLPLASIEQCWDISIAIGKSPAIVSYMAYMSRHHKGPGIHADNNEKMMKSIATTASSCGRPTL